MRRITIEIADDGSGFDVVDEYGRRHSDCTDPKGALTLGEMIEQVLYFAGKHERCYPMRTEAENRARWFDRQHPAK